MHEPQCVLQAVARIHRMTQRRATQVVRFVVDEIFTTRPNSQLDIAFCLISHLALSIPRIRPSSNMFSIAARYLPRQIPGNLARVCHLQKNVLPRQFGITTSFELPDPANTNGRKKHQLTKIVATIGPTSEQLEPLNQVVGAGMKIMRLNFSHATTEEVELRMKNLALSQVSRVSIVGIFKKVTANLTSYFFQ